MNPVRQPHGEQVHAEFEVLQQRTAPRSEFVARDRVQCGQPGELSVAAHGDRAGEAARRLDRRDRGAELQVLQLGELEPEGAGEPRATGRSAAEVAHPDVELNGTNGFVAEQMVCRAYFEAVGRGTAVRVDHHDHYPVPVRVGTEPVVQLAVGGVERVSLARTRFRALARDEVQIRVVAAVAPPHRAHDAGGAVVGVVVHDPHVRAAEGAAQVLHRLADHHLLVAAGDEEVPGKVGRIADRSGLAAQVRHDDHHDVHEERDAHGERERLRDRQQDLQAGAAHAAARFSAFVFRVASHTNSTSEIAPPMTLTSEPSSVWPQ